MKYFVEKRVGSEWVEVFGSEDKNMALRFLRDLMTTKSNPTAGYFFALTEVEGEAGFEMFYRGYTDNAHVTHKEITLAENIKEVW